MPNGYGFFANRRLVTVFSAPRYQIEMNNRGAIMVIDKNMCVSYALLNPVEENTAGAENFKRTFTEQGSMSNSSFTQ
jgi:hypothetical protein